MMFETFAATFMFIWFVAPLPAFVANTRRRQPLEPVLLYGITVMAGFLFAVAAAGMADLHLNSQIERLDFDHDGRISGGELTAEAQQLMDDRVNDTGRSMVIVTGLPLSAIWYCICFIVLYTGRWFCSRSISKQELPIV